MFDPRPVEIKQIDQKSAVAQRSRIRLNRDSLARGFKQQHGTMDG
jgi:hypothetical protein